MWEYLVIARNTPFDADSLNDRGRDGWELVTIIHDLDRHEWLAYYKRPRQQAPPPPLSS